MKKLFVLSVVTCTIIGIGCSPKTSHAISNSGVETKDEILNKYSSEQLASGKELFTTHCGKCHGLKDPESRTPQQWNSVLKKMIPRTNLNDDEGALVRAYLIANAKQN